MKFIIHFFIKIGLSFRLHSIFFFVVVFAIACKKNARETYVGTYAAINYINTTDTIYVLSNNVYARKVYDKEGRLVLNMKSSLEMNGDEIVFHSFFLNLDRDIIQYPELLSDTVMEMNVSVERSFLKVQFCTGYLEGENCYSKVE